MKLSKCHFFTKEIHYLVHILSTKGIWPLPLKTQAIQNMYPPKKVHAFFGLVGYYRKFIKNFAKIAKPLMILTCQQVIFDWAPTHHEAFLKLKESIIPAPILWYPDPNMRYIVYYQCIRWCLWSTGIPRNMMVWNFLLLFFCTHFKKHRENGAQWNKKLMESITSLPNGIIISREQIL